MFAKEEIEQIHRIIDEKIEKDKEKRRKSVERIIKHLDDIEANGEKRNELITILMNEVATLEKRINQMVLDQKAECS